MLATFPELPGLVEGLPLSALWFLASTGPGTSAKATIDPRATRNTTEEVRMIRILFRKFITYVLRAQQPRELRCGVRNNRRRNRAMHPKTRRVRALRQREDQASVI